MLNEGKDIRKHLAWMIFIGQAVNDRYARVGSEALNDLLTERADHDHVAHAGHHLRSIFDRLTSTELTVARVEVNGRTAELMHAGFK